MCFALCQKEEKIASIESVNSNIDIGVFQLCFLEGHLIECFGHLTLDLSDHTDQCNLFKGMTTDYLVEVEVHRCSDLTELQTGISNLYYVWQRRFAKSPKSCPRCKNYLKVKARLAINSGKHKEGSLFKSYLEIDY
jgi:hypothetical protein